MPKPIRAEITDSDNEGGFTDEIAEGDALVGLRAEDVVGMPGETIGYAEKTLDPQCGPRSQAGEMDVQM